MSQRRYITDNAIECDYLFFRFRRSQSYDWVKLPSVEIKLRPQAAEFSSFALVDSGSNVTMLMKQQAELLALKPAIRGGKPMTSEITGAGGKFDAEVLVTPELDVMKHGVPFAAFRGRQVYVPRQEDAIPYAILGRDTIFHRFVVSFDDNRQKVIFRRV